MSATKRAAVNRNEAQIEAKKLLQSADYIKSLKDRIIRGELMPQVETMLWHYAYGKPPDVIHVEGGTLVQQLEQLSDEKLAERARSAVERLERAAAIKLNDAADFERFDDPFGKGPSSVN